MRTPPLLLLLRWASALLAALTARSEEVLYGKVGDEVVLLPHSLPPTVSKIHWKDGDNLAVEWDGGDAVDYYRHYKGRSDLNLTTAAFTIRALTPGDSATYWAFASDNDKEVPCGRVQLQVLGPVPVPTVTPACDPQGCRLTCEGDTSGAAPVTYTWRSGETELINETGAGLSFTKEARFPEFSCSLKNPVSLERSLPFANPFTETTEAADGPKISVGITVFVSLLAVLLLLVIFHRWKAGMWFFEKESFPWTSDFWMKEAQEPDGASPEEEEQEEQEEQRELNSAKLPSAASC